MKYLRFPLLALLLVLPLLAQDRKKDDPDLLDDLSKGTKVRFVQAGKEGEAIDTALFWRVHHGNVAAATTPTRLFVDDKEVIAPVLNPKATGTGQQAYTFPTEGRAKLTPGRHVLQPGNILIEVKDGEISSSHPAVKSGKNELMIRCKAVRLEVVDSRGAPVPASIQIGDVKGSYLREETRFSVLIAYLPVGCEYTSSLGSFSLAADGAIKGGTLQPEVKVTAEGLRKTVPASPAATYPVVADALRLTGPTRDKKPGPSCLLYVPTVVAPGGPVWMAVSRRDYRAETGQDFSAEHFSFKIGDAPLTLTPAKGVAGAQDQIRASRALNTSMEDLAWIVPRLPAQGLGPMTIHLTTRHLGSHNLTLLAMDSGALQLIPHRWRTVFARHESAPYQLLLPKGTKAGEARIVAHLDERKEPVPLGTMKIPEVSDGIDCRWFTVQIADLPPGKHQLWVESPSGNSGKVPMQVVSLEPRSPFFTHSMSGCTACWPTTDEGLQVLEHARLEMVAATGAFSNLDTAMPRIDPALAGRLRGLGLPPDLAVAPTSNDRLLERLLRHRLKFIDMTVVRAPGFYMEGLSYHHSYQPSVERMVRRMSLFTQQTADYPSFFGVNYSWFPQLYGYSEGGVPTDAHVGERNRALEDELTRAGFRPITADQRERIKNKGAPGSRAWLNAQMAIEQAVNWRNMSQEFGWGKHNRLYNRAVRQIRDDLACTLFENAGHDEPKRLRSMFKDMTAQCYESYTDFGDWPMSAGFVTDWSHGQSPGQPVWLTTCWGTSEEGKMKSLFHAFARGLEGGGVPMQDTFPLPTLERRGKGLRFVSQYGAIVKHAVPDRRIAILARDAHAVFGRLVWDCHAVYSHLTRLGYPPVILADTEMMKDGIPEHVKLLVLVKEEMPFESRAKEQIAAFQKRGGKLLIIGSCVVPFDNATTVAETPKHLCDLKGFHADSHQEMWKEFERLREPLSAALAKTGLPVLAQVEPALGYALTMDAGPVRYVAVIGDARGTHSNAFEPTANLQVSLEGTGWKIRDLVKQKDLPAEANSGRTLIKVDLTTEPTTLLALYRSPPDGITLARNEPPGLILLPKVLAANGKDLGQVPIRLVLRAPDGSQREDFFSAADIRHELSIAARDLAGRWKVTIQELLTGRTATTEFDIERAEFAVKEDEPGPKATASDVGRVHTVNTRHIFAFADLEGPKLVIVEPDQAHLLPVAQKLVKRLKEVGQDVRIWQVKPEEFDTHPIRWYPMAEDIERRKRIDAGQLIGVRQSLQPFIDTVKRVHVPERGGYSDIDPPYLVGQHCIVFSGGKLAESLRAVTPWMDTPHNPGKGQARLVACFSPFMANRHAIAIIAHDRAGFDTGADTLVGLIEPHKTGARSGGTISSNKLETTTLKTVQIAVPTPYAGFTPVQRVERLLSTPDGKAVLFLKGKQDNVVFVDAAGKTTSLHLETALASHATLDERGNLRLPFRKVTATHPGWGFPTEVELTLRSIAADGKPQSELNAFRGPPGVPDFESGLVWSPDGTTALLGRPGGFFWRTKDDKAWRRYDDLPHVGTRFSLLYPRQPVSVTFSPEGRYVLLTMDSRPPFGGLNSSAPQPWSSETILFDLKEGKRLWALSAPEGKSTYAVQVRDAALSRDAERAVFVDHEGTLRLIDRQGKVLLSESVTKSGSADRVGVWMTDDGKTALFAGRNLLAIVRDGKFSRFPQSGVATACLHTDGLLIVVGRMDGSVQAFDTEGKALWGFVGQGAAAHVAAGPNRQTLVASGLGKLHSFDAKGEGVSVTDIAAQADRGRHLVEPATETARHTPPQEYVEPGTLALAKANLGAKEIERWNPVGKSRESHGNMFHTVEGKIELKGTATGECLVHLVYRRPKENKSLKVVTDGKDGPQTFLLDLPTPEYRVLALPVRGPKPSVTLLSDGPVEVAELSMWSLAKWPGPNLAYVRPAGVEGKPMEKGGDDILDDLEGKKNVSGKLKDCRVWWPNTDFDAVRGPWLPATLDPLSVVDGQRFNKVAPWCDKYLNFPPCKGGFFTVDFKEEQAANLITTYDRSLKQSEVAAQLAVFSFDGKEPLTGGQLLGGFMGNDQFWRLVPTKGKVKVLGVHVFKDDQTATGLSEVEVYQGR